MDDVLLMTPGPVSVEPEVLETAGGPIPIHYGDDWVAFYHEIIGDLKKIFQTTGDMHLVTGPGSAALEMGINSISKADETVVVVNNGFFGLRLAQIAGAYGINVVEVKGTPEQRMTAEDVGPALDDNPDVVAVLVVHHDTTTGMQNDIESIAKLANERGALCMVDAVSSLGGINLPVDDWGIDVCVAVANKCLGGLPGIAPIVFSDRAWEIIKSKETPGWYLNVRTWRWYVENWGEWHPQPTTVAGNIAYALNTAVKAVLREGLQAVFERHKNVAARVRDGLRDLGFEMLLPEGMGSPVLTTSKGLPGMDIDQFATWMLEEKRMHISPGLGDFAGLIFRIGHMGRSAHMDVAERFLETVKEYKETQM